MITDLELKRLAREERIPLNDVFLKDKPPLKLRSGGYIINLDDEETGRGGTHWVALWIPKKINQPLFFFDSYGFTLADSIINIIKRRGGAWKNNKIIYNDMQIQDVKDGYCGSYCLFFLKIMSKHPMSNSNPIEVFKFFKSLWDTNPKMNDDLLKKYDFKIFTASKM